MVFIRLVSCSNCPQRQSPYKLCVCTRSLLFPHITDMSYMSILLRLFQWVNQIGISWSAIRCDWSEQELDHWSFRWLIGRCYPAKVAWQPTTILTGSVHLRGAVHRSISQPESEPRCPALSHSTLMPWSNTPSNCLTMKHPDLPHWICRITQE